MTLLSLCFACWRPVEQQHKVDNNVLSQRWSHLHLTWSGRQWYIGMSLPTSDIRRLIGIPKPSNVATATGRHTWCSHVETSNGTWTSILWTLKNLGNGNTWLQDVASARRPLESKSKSKETFDKNYGFKSVQMNTTEYYWIHNLQWSSPMILSHNFVFSVSFSGPWLKLGHWPQGSTSLHQAGHPTRGMGFFSGI